MPESAGMTITQARLSCLAVAFSVLAATLVIPLPAGASPIMAPSTYLGAPATAALSPLDLTGFELREITNWGISVLPQQQIQQQKQGTAFRLSPHSITLISPARKPTAYHARQPRTELCETKFWRIQDGTSLLDEVIRLDVLPKQGHLILAELSTNEDRPDLFHLTLDGDRVVLHGQMAGMGRSDTTVGSLTRDHIAHVSIRTESDGQLMISLNGTSSQLRLKSASLKVPVVFRTGAHTVGDIGTTPDHVSVTLTRIVARHEPEQSHPRP